MFEAMLEISLFAVPIAAAAFAGGFFTARVAHRAKTVPSSPVAFAPRNTERVEPPPTNELLLKKMQLEIIELQRQLDAEKDRSQKWELLAELKAEKAPKEMSMPVAVGNDTLPTNSSEWTILLLKQRIKELEKQIK